ncbi:cyclic nucleotide-binding domain-containing protein [Marinobacterium aestuariivivens]|uniref:Cyclic nucleotide-binding domain-containing protein n=1 Tax=Marinobacterium aestuariivivens TaxID=1698799 RepID=A0ABW2A8Q8_9GAMM
MHAITTLELTREVTPESLRECSVFGALSLDAVRFLIQEGKGYRLEPNDRLFDYGDRGDSFFVVLSGAIEFYARYFDSYSYTRTACFGDEIGYVAMIALHDRSGRAIAREESLVLEISAALYSDLHDRYPFDFGVIVLNLARNMARLIRSLSEELAIQRLKR